MDSVKNSSRLTPQINDALPFTSINRLKNRIIRRTNAFSVVKDQSNPRISRDKIRQYDILASTAILFNTARADLPDIKKPQNPLQEAYFIKNN